MINALLLIALLGSFGVLGLLLAHEFPLKIPLSADTGLHTGDRIIYSKHKVSVHPGPRAYDIHPAEQGENYSYVVDKFWIVETVLDDGRILVTTRSKKQHYLDRHDPNLHKAGLITRLRYRNRFPAT